MKKYYYINKVRWNKICDKVDKMGDNDLIHQVAWIHFINEFMNHSMIKVTDNQYQKFINLGLIRERRGKNGYQVKNEL